MKPTSKNILIRVSIIASLFFCLALGTLFVHLQQPQIFNLNEVRPIFDLTGKYAGKLISINRDVTNNIGERRVQLINGKRFKVYSLVKTIVCNDAKRIISIGPKHFDHPYQGSPSLYFYDFKGSLLAEHQNIIYGRYKHEITKEGDIYIAGQSLQKGVKKVVIKYNKNGIKEWELEIDGANEITSIKWSDKKNRLVVAYYGYGSKQEYGLNLLTLKENGQIVNTFTGYPGSKRIIFNGADDIIIFSATTFKILDIDNLENITPDDNKLGLGQSGIRQVFNLNKNLLAVIDSKKRVWVLKFDSKNNISLVKKIQYEDNQYIKHISLIDTTTIDIYIRSKFEIIRQTIDLYS